MRRALASIRRSINLDSRLVLCLFRFGGIFWPCKPGLEPLGRAAGVCGTHDGTADGDPRGARFQHAIEVFSVIPPMANQGSAVVLAASRTTTSPASSGSENSLVGLGKTGPTPR